MDTTTTRNGLDVIQDMIDISAIRLEGLRTQCATSATLTQQEIRSLETKLVRMFSELLLTKGKLPERIPSSGLAASSAELRQWLRVVGLSPESLQICLQRLNTLEQLLDKSDTELKDLLGGTNPNIRGGGSGGGGDEDIRRLTGAMFNLRKCRDSLKNGDKDIENLYWDSWDRHHHIHHHHHRIVGTAGAIASPRSHRLIIKKNRQSPVCGVLANDNSNRFGGCSDLIQSPSAITTPDDVSYHGSIHTLTPSPSPPNSPFIINSTGGGGGNNSISSGIIKLSHRKSGTPPPKKKHQTLLPHHPSTPSHVSSAPNTCCNTSTIGGSNQGVINSNTACNVLSSSQIVDSQLLSKTRSYDLAQSIGNQEQQLPSSAVATQQQSAYFIHSSVSCNTSASNTPTLIAQQQQQQQQHQISHLIMNRSKLYNESNSDTTSITSMQQQQQQQQPQYQNEVMIMENSNNLPVPRSPIQLGMGHQIQHRFAKVFKVMSNCDYCQRQMFFGLKCKECKYRCHKDCETNVPPSCGLPREFVDEFKKTLINDVFQAPGATNTSPNLSSRSSCGGGGSYLSANRRQKTSISYAPDSSSPGSSCNSSSPSSPALFNLHSTTSHQSYGLSSSSNSSMGGGCSGGGMLNQMQQTPTPLSVGASGHKQTSQFNFPDVTITHQTTTKILHVGCGGGGGAGATGSIGNNNNNNNNMGTVQYANEHQQQQQQKQEQQQQLATANISISSSNCSSVYVATDMTTNPGKFIGKSFNQSVSNNTNTVNQIRPPLSELSDTHKSNDSDKTVSLSGSTSASTDSDRTPVRVDSTEEGDSGHWTRQASLSLKEWDIPYDDLKLLEKIGKGRFGTVHRALWHGDVAVKLLKEDYLDDERTLEAFKLEVANFKKTRHENLVLFMGACMNPPYLAIVTSLCKGNTLYTFIHLRRDKFTINRTTLVAQQISQGMGYLHARGIYHKDLRTKNIFLENGKVIITDFGLFSSTKLLYCDLLGLGIPNGWLCYLAPELIRTLTPYKPTDEILPFSKASDIYSFGTVWYELLCGEFPFKPQPAEAIIWQVGRGMKQTLANLQTSRDVKDILMLCWSFQADDRPDFSKLLTLLERLPKKRLARSPSHPVQLSRSAESVF